MKFKNHLNLLALSLLLVVFFASSCGDDGDSKNKDNKGSESSESGGLFSSSDDEKEVPAVCLWSALSVRETPTAKGKWVTTIYLGEEATYLGETVTDETPKKPVDYVKVRLTDGKEGWAAKRFMAIDATPYALTGISKLYKRPDILAGGKNEFETMQFVVVLEEKDDWARVKGIEKSVNWYREGWVKKENLTNEKLDVTVAILAARALGKKDEVKRQEALEDIIDNSDLSASQFIPTVKSKLESLKMPSGDEMTDTGE